MKTGAQLIIEERERQIHGEGWTAENDDGYTGEELIDAAAVYMSVACEYASGLEEVVWPWHSSWFKPGDPASSLADRIRCLVKAGALIAAEIDRLQRA